MNESHEEDISPKSAVIAGVILPFLIPFIYVIMLPFLLLRAWALMLLYGWFLQPLIHIHISYWNVFGLLVLIGVFTAGSTTNTAKNEKWYVSLFKVIAITILALISVLVGYIVKGWI